MPDNRVTSTTYAVGDDSWLGSQHGTDSTESGTLDVSAFTSGTHYPNGFFKGGIPLGKITASGKYGPYGASPSEVQTLTVDATGGTFTLTFDGETTAAIAEAATAAAVQTALEALSNINPGDVTVTGAAGGPWTITFAGQYTGTNVPAMTTGAGSLTGGAQTAVIATTTAGGGAVTDGSETLVGFLYKPVPAPTDTATDVPCAILTHGKVREANLPVAVDAAGKADVAGRIRFI